MELVLRGGETNLWASKWSCESSGNHAWWYRANCWHEEWCKAVGTPYSYLWFHSFSWILALSSQTSETTRSCPKETPRSQHEHLQCRICDIESLQKRMTMRPSSEKGDFYNSDIDGKELFDEVLDCSMLLRSREKINIQHPRELLSSIWWWRCVSQLKSGHPNYADSGIIHH